MQLSWVVVYYAQTSPKEIYKSLTKKYLKSERLLRRMKDNEGGGFV
jgi:hypothetical protein